MQSILQIAKYTFHEALRRRFMNVLLLFGVGLIAILPLLARWSPGAELNMLTDWGLFFIRFFAILMAVLLGATLIPTEIDKKTIHVLLAKPVNRVHILFGKLVGVFATVAANIVVMGVVFIAVMLAKRPVFEGQDALHFLYSNLAAAIVLMLFEILVLTSITIAVSTVSSWLFTAVFSLSIYGAGQITASLGRLATPENYPQA
ncbi:MAG: ABC transporter permease, partial [Armatimonadota bacterium]